jgi:hypothetical protein
VTLSNTPFVAYIVVLLKVKLGHFGPPVIDVLKDILYYNR